jgi:hypothetical protein
MDYSMNSPFNLHHMRLPLMAIFIVSSFICCAQTTNVYTTQTTWTVPTSVTSISVKVYGGQGAPAARIVAQGVPMRLQGMWVSCRRLLPCRQAMWWVFTLAPRPATERII